MLRGYAVDVVRDAERAAMASLPEGTLMQRAARGLAATVIARAAERDAQQVLVLVGPGDNGGDALWAAAMVAVEQPDLDVRVLTLTGGHASSSHQAALEAVDRADVSLHTLDPDGELDDMARRWLAGADLVVDGLLGIGGRPGLRGAMAAAAAEVPDAAYRIAVDLPSGADPHGRERAEQVLASHETVTFGVVKPVHLLPATQDLVGRLTLVDIGIESTEGPEVERLEAADVARMWPVPGAADDKYTRGVLGVLAGSERYPGAAVLTCLSAVEAGAGMVRHVGPPTSSLLVLQTVPEVVPRTGRCQAWVIGPGLDVAEGSVPGHAQVRAALRALESDVPCVVDAGGLDLLRDVLRQGPRRAPTLLTPHAGELARLLTALARRPAGGPAGGAQRQHGESVSPEDVRADPVGHARAAAEATGCTVLLKGSVTIVVDPDPQVPVRAQAEAPAWLATAGAGDVLAGVCGVLLAAGLSPSDAGAVGAFVHGRAARVANPGGPVRASAVARALPGTLAALLEPTAAPSARERGASAVG
ncbi:bifunctional ADP-dependent NAD(P)H-hydrate dehydratase/NAD(P)H-hydrate epimerase [Ornithinimicrobium panacihumi]|uniref:bifunctional ADP-dependent NAD(P)H-hydrate dehydratase/NAD(P)H-hydrate epimerase n=1 Tax=Ornithinimicrobium panacihumi TaxID=2008449 RepID=UPI003F886E27